MADLDTRVGELLAEYASVAPPASGPLDPALLLDKDLGIESLSMVSLMLRLAEELEVDVVALGVDLGRLDTVGDLLQLARKMLDSKSL